ncbi:hypothetical protein GALMADRAFT_147072 [Galerina marginata CBS 339.88]|uniref:OsmC-like protein n=1 Tax=Galerina marginata (strain CBS 339.88) TaxID=685588 RepID=A0A067SC34_GALM3|nr:hypothetical protein GALMADRAFT_147072 [Galerina marginata CBS 339.88]
MFVPTARRLLFNAKSASLKLRTHHVPSRTLVTLKDVKYTATATAEGPGWNGTTTSNGLTVTMAVPKVMGGTGEGANPEQLLALGYSSCLLGSIQAVAEKLGKSDMAATAKVHASVHVGTPNELAGYGFAVDVKVEGVDEELLKAGHEFCPYSRALTNGTVVNVSLA